MLRRVPAGAPRQRMLKHSMTVSVIYRGVVHARDAAPPWVPPKRLTLENLVVDISGRLD